MWFYPLAEKFDFVVLSMAVLSLNFIYVFDRFFD